MTLLQVTSWGEEHGLIATFPNSVKFDDFKHVAPEIKEKLKKKKKDDERMVKCRYINHQEKELGRYKQPYVKYAGEPIRMYNLIHNHEYTLPMGLIDSINEMETPVREGLQSVGGKDVNTDGTPLSKDRKEKIHEVIPVGFK